MKIKVYVVDFEIPPRVKRWGLRIGIPVAVLLGGGAVAYAAGLVTWSQGQTLNASDLNNNFSYLQSEIAGDGGVQGEVATLQGQATTLQGQVTTLQGQVTMLQAAPTTYETSSNTIQTGTQSADLPYTDTSLTLPAGTYLVSGFATVTTTNVADGVQIGLYDVTSASDVVNSRSGVGQTFSCAGCTTYGPVSLATSHVVTITVPTTYEVKAYRNGGSTLSIGYPGGGLAGPAVRMVATPL
jgi:hypothetical protein